MLRNFVSGSAQAAGESAAGAAFTKFCHAVFFVLLTLTVTGVVLSACSRGKKSSEQTFSKRVVQLGQPVPKGGGRYKVGNPYKIAGRWYTPVENPSYDRVGIASWYGELFHGRYTANGEIYDMNALTAAHTTLPLPSYARVTNLQNGRSLVLRVNDRGPYAHDRIIDLSRRSAQALGFERNGTARVRVQYIGGAPLNGDDSLERQVYASRPWARMAQATQTQIMADSIVVGSLPVASNTTKPAANAWATQSRTASAPPIPTQMGDYSIQAASFRNRDFAVSLRTKLASLGAAYVQRAKVAGKTYYRVRLGPYDRRHDADETLRAVIGTGATGARIVRN